ncbi:type III pantothenate kinase [Thalassotalea fusca]
MTLLVDIGNTRSKFCLVLPNGELSDVFTVANEQFTAEYLSDNYADVAKVFVASVNNPRLFATISAWGKEHSIATEEINTEKHAFGVICAYEQYRNLGVDRWLAILGANKLYPDQPVIVIDAGTALTIDAINNDGEHLGGWIQPGIQTALDAILQRTTKVFGSRTELSEMTFGVSTEQCLQLGCWASVVGSVKLAHDLFAKNTPSIKLVFTGGDGESLSTQISGDCVYHKDLIFHGMSRYLNR